MKRFKTIAIGHVLLMCILVFCGGVTEAFSQVQRATENEISAVGPPGTAVSGTGALSSYDPTQPINENNLPPGITVTVNERPAANPMDSWNLSFPSNYAGNWVLQSSSLQPHGTPGPNPRPQNEVWNEVRGDFPVGSTLSLTNDGNFTMVVDGVELQGNAGVHQDYLVLEVQHGNCSDCSTRMPLKVVQAQGSQLVLGMELQDEDEPYMLHLELNQSTQTSPQ